MGKRFYKQGIGTIDTDEFEERRYKEDSRVNGYDLEKYNRHIGISSGYKSFAISTVQRKSFKTFENITNYGKHLMREIDTPNADPTMSKYNKIIIGKELIDQGFNVGDIAREKLSVVKLRKNAALARSVTFTGSHQFEKHLVGDEPDKWIEETKKFIEEHFHDDCIFACVHADESTLHVHALITAVEYEPEKRKFFLRTNKYFGSGKLLSQMQTDYANHLSKTFNCFIRCKMGSKAKNVSLKQFYALMNQKIDTNSLTPQQIENIVKDNYLLSKKYKEMRKTYMEIERDPDVNELLDAISELEENNNTYKSVIQELANSYGVDKKLILSLAKKHSKSKEKEYQRERKRG